MILTRRLNLLIDKIKLLNLVLDGLISNLDRISLKAINKCQYMQKYLENCYQ